MSTQTVSQMLSDAALVRCQRLRLAGRLRRAYQDKDWYVAAEVRDRFPLRSIECSVASIVVEAIRNPYVPEEVVEDAISALEVS